MVVGTHTRTQKGKSVFVADLHSADLFSVETGSSFDFSAEAIFWCFFVVVLIKSSHLNTSGWCPAVT